MYGDDKYMFCAVRVNDLFITNNEWRKNGLGDIYSFNKTHAPTGFNSTIQHLEKTSLQGIRGSII